MPSMIALAGGDFVVAEESAQEVDELVFGTEAGKLIRVTAQETQAKAGGITYVNPAHIVTVTERA